MADELVVLTGEAGRYVSDLARALVGLIGEEDPQLALAWIDQVEAADGFHVTAPDDEGWWELRIGFEGAMLARCRRDDGTLEARVTVDGVERAVGIAEVPEAEL